MSGERRRDAVAAALVGLVAFLPFLRGVLAGSSLYFRDLALYFLPLRRLALDGLRSGDVRFWNPYLHEGVPLSLPALGYPPDLLALLRPDEVGISTVLALHVPLAALGFYALARRLLEVPPVAAAGGALVYALGGFLLSAVNLYVSLQAAAWAPLVALTLARATRDGGRRAVARAALVLAIALATTGVEIVAQAVIVGALLGLGVGPRRWGRDLGRCVAVVVLATALAAPVLVLVMTQVATGARGSGLTTDVVLAHSVHPFTLLQTIVGGLYGNLADLAGEWWGQNFFPRGFPYVLSLYLGPAALALAAVGTTGRHPARTRLVLLAGAGLVLALGRFAGLAPLVEALPPLRVLRYPTKAFFTVHVTVALLAALGLAALTSPEGRRAWTRLAAAAAGLGGVLCLLLLLPRAAPGVTSAFAAAFFPPGFDEATRTTLLARVLTDAAIGGSVALAVAAMAALARTGRLGAPRAALLVLALLGGDLLRTGAGLNPMVTGAFFRPSAELAAELPRLAAARAFTCPFDESLAYRRARLAQGVGHEAWTFAVAFETLTPAFNVGLRVPTALSPDLTMLVPEERVLSPLDPGCRDLDGLLPRLLRAGVTRILSLDPLDHPSLARETVLRPERIAPLAVHVYRLASPLPRTQLIPTGAAGDGSGGGGGDVRGRVESAAFQEDGVDLAVEADRPAVLVVRDGWAPGWTATVNGRPAVVRRADERHRAVDVPRGRSVVTMSYRPPGLAGSVGLSVAATLALVWLAWWPGPPSRASSPPTA